MINGHGDDAHLFERKIASNFSSNVYNRLDLSGLGVYLCQNISSIHSYPEPDAVSLRKQIAVKYGILQDEVCVTNGAIEAIYLIAQAFRGNRTSIVIPTFSEYEDACLIHEHQLSFIESLDNLNPDTQLVWLCNPNNPNGFIYKIQYLEDLIKRYSNTCFVFDQSYASFTQESIFSIDEAIQYPNVILLHSLTKCFAIPGLRLGYFTASKQLVDKIKRYSMPWSVNNMALLAGKYLLKSEAVDFADLLKESERVQNCLGKIKGLKVHSSNMHYFLCQVEKGTAGELKAYLVEKYGLLIRDASNFRGLDQTYFRIAVQSESENNQLIKAITEWIKLSF